MAKKGETGAETPSTDTPRTYRRIASVIRPLLKLEIDKPAFVKIDGTIFTGKAVPATDGKKAMEPARIVNVVDLSTGEECQMILNAVLESTLTETYPNDTYDGRSFEITKLPKRSGKQYHDFRLYEVEA